MQVNYACLEAFLEVLLAERIASSNTICAYRTDIEQLAAFCAERNLPIERVEYQHLVQYIESLHAKHLSYSSLARKISSIRQFFSFLFSEKIKADNPADLLVMPKKQFTLPKALSEKDITCLLDVANSETYTELRNNVMLEILYSSGMRISELVTLKVEVLKYDLRSCEMANAIMIQGKGGKERLVMLGDVVIEKLKRYLIARDEFLKKHAQQSRWLFPSLDKDHRMHHITRQRFGQILKQLAVRCNINPSTLSPHKIRHSFATHMLQHGANIKVIQELMGHSNINSTQLYTKICSEITKNAVQKHPLVDYASQNVQCGVLNMSNNTDDNKHENKQ